MIRPSTTRYGYATSWREPRGKKAPGVEPRELTDLERVCLTCIAPVEVCDATDAGANKGPCPWRARWLGDDTVMQSTCAVAPLDAHKARIDALMESSNWSLNARQIYDLLVVDGYTGSKPTVRRYVRLRREEV